MINPLASRSLLHLSFVASIVICFTACTKKSDSNDQYIRFTLDGKEKVFSQSPMYFQIPASGPDDFTTAYGSAALEEGASGYYVTENEVNIDVSSRTEFRTGVEYTNANPGDMKISIGYLNEQGTSYMDDLYEELPELSDAKITLTKIDKRHFEGTFSATVYAGDENEHHFVSGTFKLKD